jgi:hypothetical protein
MSQRDSGYQRKLLDQYETPAWVTQALVPHLPTCKIWEPACGTGKMVATLRQAGFGVIGTDITQGVDFLKTKAMPDTGATITNPPYALAREFIERALQFDTLFVSSPCCCAPTLTMRRAGSICLPTVRRSPRRSC